MVQEVVASRTYVLGPQVAAFEAAFASFIGARHCVGVNSGTSALHLALIAAGVGPGDEVVTVPMTFVATSWAITYVGATPVFVDVDPDTYTMDVSQVRARITRRTKAIIPVHLYGQPADMGPLAQLCRDAGIPIIEDAAQAPRRALRRPAPWALSGSAGASASTLARTWARPARPVPWSPTTTASPAVSVASAITPRPSATTTPSSDSTTAWTPSRAQCWAVKLKRLATWTAARRRLAARYLDGLRGLPLRLPTEAAGRGHVWHLFVVRHSRPGPHPASAGGTGHPDRAALPGAGPPAAGLSPPGLPAGRFPDHRARSPANACHCRCFPR